MSKERELLRRLLESNMFDSGLTGEWRYYIKELLTQPEQEPVAWQFRTVHGEDTVCPGWDAWEDCTELKFNNVSEYVTKGFYQVRKLYTSPQTREPLSEATIEHYIERLGSDFKWESGFLSGVAWAEKAHGIGE